MSEIFVNRCRACAVLQECSNKMVFLFDKKLSEMFKDCTSLEINTNDSLPSYICFECFGHLSNFNKFRQSCITSDAYFREQIIAEQIKEEPLIGVSVKLEEHPANEDFESELFETEYIDDVDDDFEEYDSDYTPQNDVASADDTNSNSNTGEKYICDYCGQVFSRKSYIGAHMTKHKNGPAQTSFPCTVEGCSKVFNTRKSINRHRLKVHKLKAGPRPKVTVESEKIVKFNCQECPKWFTMQLKLDAHIRSYHHGLKGYKCEHCEKEFCKYRSYNSHLRNRHGTDETEKHYCTYDGCDRVYNAQDSLRKHIKRFHLGEAPPPVNRKLICDQCGRSFKNGFSLKEHSYSHSGITPFACNICPKKFISNYKLKIHTMRHMNVKPFECPTCGLRKTTNKELKAHLNFHSKEITYPCKECPRVFPSYSAVNRHVRIHHRNHKPYICPHCERAFAKAETMKNHVMTHTGEKPFSCSVCGHRFIQSVALKAHMKVHEKGVK
ncbi:zinc finger protein 501-like [Bradysia coprophila]|uniref:zinc finger protein 501-like n=1 Tax=Bradysia coprophila TaxID=38358 RepID=UPI00187DAB04|nr:zinc finger protein 501-like [Bradysia coprophila]